MRIVFRIDVSRESGFGHLSRCLTLAKALKERGDDISFIVRDHFDHSYDVLTINNFSLFLLERQPDSIINAKSNSGYKNWLATSLNQDAKETIDICKDNGAIDWLIIDHYAIDITWHQSLRTYVRNIMVIDDLANRSLDCDLLLNQTNDFKTETYNNLIPLKTKKLIGGKYVLLRDEFSQLRKKAIQKRREKIHVDNIIIFFGSMDHTNISMNVINALEDSHLNRNIKIRIILGKEAPYLNIIKERLKSCTLNYELLIDVTNMEELLFEADIAIGAGGMNSWERCCLGLPTLITSSAENQIDNIASLKSSGAVIIWDSINDLISKLNTMISDQGLIQSMGEKAFKVCDGKGTERVINEIINAS